MSSEIVGDSIGRAWLRATDYVLTSEDVFHLMVRISGEDDPEVRSSLDDLLSANGRQSVETVANTVFPSEMARSSEGHQQLVDRYLRIYPKLRKQPQNSRGTYFGRMVAYPGADGDVNQLAAVIGKLRQSIDGQGLTSCYEITIIAPSHDARVRMQFPCLSYVSLHMQKNSILHMFASYRNHYMIERAYGNYLGLRRLQAYIAAETGLGVGELAVLSGHATIDLSRPAVRSLLEVQDF